MPRVERSAASLSTKCRSTARRRRVADRSRQRCPALSGRSARTGKRCAFRASRRLQNSLRIAESLRRINAPRRPGTFPVYDFRVVAKSRSRTVGRRRTNDPLQAADQSGRRRRPAAAFTKESGGFFRRHNFHEQQRWRIARSGGRPNYSFAFSEYRRAAELLRGGQSRGRSTRLHFVTAWRAWSGDFFRDALSSGKKPDARSLHRTPGPLPRLHPTELSGADLDLSAASVRERRSK